MYVAATKMYPIIAVASGKGGTGKTTFAVNLACSLQKDVTYIDADVEEPNGYIFFKPKITEKQDVKVMLPSIDLDLCNKCGKCSEVCKFNAIARLLDDILVFPELCHSCGACIITCPQKAISEGERIVGKISFGKANGIDFIEGRLNEGEAKSPPVIRNLHQYFAGKQTTIIDVSPGTSCPVIEGTRKADFTVLVTEPTPFGLHDLSLAVGMIRQIGIPHGVVINKANLGDGKVEDYCEKKEIPILMKIPFEKEFAHSISKGETLIFDRPELRKEFINCFEMIKQLI